ncbi:uncharacterized protein LOC131613628 [Vicia villosa]|uniref:uncharacterized protein LOC131613628 n=1 Tax=Vicia villosa TaxID=3911 RepID=UPI00273CCB0F|nr:uncharacterized protein LOC131613628 [Vicia villosa]
MDIPIHDQIPYTGEEGGPKLEDIAAAFHLPKAEINKVWINRRDYSGIPMDFLYEKAKIFAKALSMDALENIVRKKITSAGPVKSKAVTKSKGVGPSKSWSSVIPKKRKERETVEPESDVELNVPDIPSRKKLTTNKLTASIPEVPINNVSFPYASGASRWKYVLQKRLAVERELAPNALENKEVLIQEAGLLKTVCNLPKCEAQAELEVTDNQVCQVITAKQVKSWPMKEKLTASKLSIKYAMLHKKGAVNWVPINHKSTISTVLGRFLYVVGTKAKFDYGAYIFDQTMKHAGSFSIKGPIAFPSLLCGIILDQYSNILNEHDVV